MNSDGDFKFTAMLRIRDEERWIERVIKSLLPLCEHVFVMDDHSKDNSADIVRSFDKERVHYLPSPFTKNDLDESRDKNWLLDKVVDVEPEWILCIDGDEELEIMGPEIIRETAASAQWHSYTLRIVYLWDDETQMRVDGVYKTFNRPSMFYMENPSFRFRTTPFGGNLHCSSIPQELLHGVCPCPARLKHYGYIDEDLRMAKFHWYNKVDPNNKEEDCYRHIIQGDAGGPKADEKLKWAGPLKLESFVE